MRRAHGAIVSAAATTLRARTAGVSGQNDWAAGGGGGAEVCVERGVGGCVERVVKGGKRRRQQART
jgi:hypothetical protein